MTDNEHSTGETLELDVGAEAAGLRLDQFLAGSIEDASRSFIKKVIKDGGVFLNGHGVTRPSRHLAENDRVGITLPPPPATDLVGEDIPLDVLFEDSEILVVNKPSGLVVHPAPGHYTGTLVHAVIFRCADFERPTNARDAAALAAIRPGIVHRLDRFTSGVMVVAKTQRAHDRLARQAREHTFDRRYVALVRGEFKEDSGRIDAAIGRSLSDRSRMSVAPVGGRDAITHFDVLERFGIASHIALKLETGRTHQIRVHLRFAGRPILGDPIYGVIDFSGWEIGNELRAALQALDGQALHAELLGIVHPVTGEHMTFRAPPPADFNRVLELLRARAAA